MFTIGQVISIIDDVDYSKKETGTIRLIEPDSEIKELVWLYIRANNEELNIQADPHIGTYWRIIEANSNKIVL